MAASALADRLAVAREVAGHTQAECIEHLATRFGAPARSQASMSRYLSGKQAMPPDVARAVVDYVDEFDPIGPSDVIEGAQTLPMAASSASEFAGLVRGLTDEPLLGPRQGALVDALIGRLAGGTPLSSEDSLAVTALMRVLGLHA